MLDITHSNQYQVLAQVGKIKSHFAQSAMDNIAELYDLHRFESATDILEFINALWAGNKYHFPLPESVEGGVHSPNPTQGESKAANNWQGSIYFLMGPIPRMFHIKFYHCGNNRGMYADRFDDSMIYNKEGHIPSPLIMLTCTALRHAFLEWQMKNGVHPKASKSKLNADRLDSLKLL
jgi:hypothetical protein